MVIITGVDLRDSSMRVHGRRLVLAGKLQATCIRLGQAYHYRTCCMCLDRTHGALI